MRPKTCRFCKEKFVPTHQMQPCCESFECKSSFMADHVAKQRAKRSKDERIHQAEARKVVKIKLDKLKTARDWTKEAQVAFNAYIRARDSGMACICCGLPLAQDAVGGGFDCGHYRSVGSAPHLRFEPLNAHGQRKQCNRWGSGRAVDYRIGLIARIGIEAVEAIESNQTPRHYGIDELKAIKAHFIGLMKELKK